MEGPGLLPLTGPAHRSDSAAATRMSAKHVRAVAQHENFPVSSGNIPDPPMTREQVAVLASQAPYLYSVFERSGYPVRVKKTRQNNRSEPRF
jgi:hypothetical protein